MKELNAKKGCKRAEEFNLDDLGDAKMQALSSGYGAENAEELLYHIRVLKRPEGLTKQAFQEICDADGVKPFIRDDFDERTFGLMRLARKILKLDEECDEMRKKEWEADNEKFLRCTCSFKSNEDYENFENFSEEKISALRDFLKNEITEEEEYEALELVYGFGEDAIPRNRAEVARILGYTYRTITHMLIRAEGVLMYPTRIAVFRELIAA